MKKALSVLLSSVMILLVFSNSNPVEAIRRFEYQQREFYRYGGDAYDDVLYYKQADGEGYRGDYEQYGALIVVNRDSLTSDGLSASGLIGVTNGLLIVTDINTSVSDILYGDLYRFIDHKTEYPLPDDVYIIGGANSVNPLLDGQFRKKGFNVKRLQGKNRIETSYRIAEEIKLIKGTISEMAVTKAYKGEADSVSIASEAIRRKMPIILTNGSNLPSSSPLGAEVDKIYAIGGSAVIKDSLIKQLHAERIAGNNRYETNSKIIKRFGKHNGCTVVSGKDENLGESLIAATMDSSCPILMTKGKPDKYVDLLSGSKKIFFANPEIFAEDDLEFIVASYGKDVFNAFKKIRNIDLSDIGLSQHEHILYTPENSYLEGTGINSNKYMIFSPSDSIDFEAGDAEYNILVSKENGRVYVMPKGYDEPIDVTHLI